MNVSYGSLAEANTACGGARACLAIADGGCNGAPYWLCTGGLYRSTQGSCIFERRRQDSAKNEAYSLAGDYLRNMLIAGVLSYGTSRHTHTYA